MIKALRLKAGSCAAVGRYVRWGLLLLLALLLAACLYAGWDIYRYSHVSETRRADAAIVLGAAAWGEQPSPVFRERINHAVDLYQAGYVGAIIFTGGQGQPDELAESVVAGHYAAGQGVRPGDILIETRSRTTRENLRYARQVADEHRLTTFLIVSDPLHMKRAMRIARDLGMEAHSSPTPTTMYRSAGSKLRFLARETYFYLKYLVFNSDRDG